MCLNDGAVSYNREVADSVYVRYFHTGYGVFHCDSMKHKVILY